MLDACLTCFDEQDVPPELIVVCNATSTDGTEEMLAERHPRVLSLRCTDDNWWRGTINVCLQEILKRCSADDYILCINDDVTFERDYTRKMLEAARKGPKRAVQSVFVDIEDPDFIIDGGSRQSLISGRFTWVNRSRRRSEFPPDYEVESSYLSGRGVIYPARAFMEVGLFSERLLSLFADYEFAFRCGRSGYSLFVNYGCVVKGDAKPTSIHRRDGKFSIRGLKEYYNSPRSSANIESCFVFSRLITDNRLRGYWLFVMMFVRVTWVFLRGQKKAPA
jgi:GT2 family glycosyltransferase